MKLGIGIPNQGDIKVKTMLSLIQAAYSLDDGAGVMFIAKEGALVPWQREEIFKIAAENCSHLLFCDTDMEFPSDTIRKMLDLQKPVLGVWSHKKQFPKAPTVHVLEREWRNATMEEKPAEPFHRIGDRPIAVGTGLMLIDMAKAVELDVPRFRAEYGGPGEDLYFCERAIAAGLEVWCDPTIPIKHIGDFEY